MLSVASNHLISGTVTSHWSDEPHKWRALPTFDRLNYWSLATCSRGNWFSNIWGRNWVKLHFPLISLVESWKPYGSKAASSLRKLFEQQQQLELKGKGSWWNFQHLSFEREASHPSPLKLCRFSQIVSLTDFPWEFRPKRYIFQSGTLKAIHLIGDRQIP